MSDNDSPVFGGSYGDTGTGKTGDALFAFPEAFIFAQPGVIPKLAKGLVGIAKPKWKPVNTLPEVIKEMRSAHARKVRPIAWLLDDTSLMQQETVRQSKLGGFELWRTVLNQILEIAYIARSMMEAHVWMTMHEQGSRVIHGTFVKGGPLLAGQAANHLPKSMDMLLRVMHEEARPGWNFAYQCNNADINFSTKDRTNTTPDLAPMNTGEILRAAGYKIPRAKGLEWQEEVIKRYVDGALAGKLKTAELASKARDFAIAKYSKDTRHIAWALRDAMDRVTLLRTRNDPLRRIMSSLTKD